MRRSQCAAGEGSVSSSGTRNKPARKPAERSFSITRRQAQTIEAPGIAWGFYSQRGRVLDPRPSGYEPDEVCLLGAPTQGQGPGPGERRESRDPPISSGGELSTHSPRGATPLDLALIVAQHPQAPVILVSRRSRQCAPRSDPCQPLNFAPSLDIRILSAVEQTSKISARCAVRRSSRTWPLRPENG